MKVLNVMERFCPKCGATNVQFIKSFCQNCYLQEHKVISVPEEIKIEFCKRCGRVRVKGKMYKQTKEIINELILSKIKLKELYNEKILIELHPLQSDRTKAVLYISGKIGNDKVSFKKEIILKFVNFCCNDCSRIAAGYFEAILQVRAPESKRKKAFDFCKNFLLKEQKHNILAVIVKKEEESTGFNLIIGSKQAAFKLAREMIKKFNAKMNTSSSLVGRKEGKDLKRSTFLVRIE